MIDWNSESWGNPETCVHEAENGSWVADRHTEGVSDQ